MTPKRGMLGFFAAAALFLSWACSGPSPSSPGVTEQDKATATPTVTVTATPTSSIDWETAAISRGSVSAQAYVYLAVNSTADLTAAVTLSGSFSGSPVALITDGNDYPISGKDYALYEATGFSYQPGQSYTITTVTSAGTATATLTAPGNITFAPLDTHGAVTQISWSVAGDYNYVSVQELTPSSQYNLNLNWDATSPVVISGSVYSGGSASTYDVYAETISQTYEVTGATASSLFQIYENTSKSVTWN